MGKILQFPTKASSKFGFQRVKSTYTVSEISQLFGLSTKSILRWTREGLIHGISPENCQSPDELLYDFRALTQFRYVRELRDKGLTFKQIESELRGQLSLFQRQEGQVTHLEVKLGPFEEALLLHDRGDPRASKEYENAIRVNDCVPDAYCNLGILEFEAGRVPKAFDCFTKAIQSDARHFESHFNLANLYFDSNNLQLARLHYELATELEPSFPNTYYNLGLVLALDQDWHAAQDMLLKFKELATLEEGEKLTMLLMALEKVINESISRRNNESAGQ